MMFRYTINPYRAASINVYIVYKVHADSDGMEQPKRSRRAGRRRHLRTVREGFYRRYVTTEVLAHWSTVKPAYRVTLEDGPS